MVPVGPAGAENLHPRVSSFLNAYTKFLRKRAEYFVVIILVATVLFIPTLQEMKFETDLDKFLPDDQIIDASRRSDGYFGAPPEAQYMLVTGHNILSASALREELNITVQAGYVDGVVVTYSLAGTLDELAKWQNINGNWTRDAKRGLLNLSDADVEGRRDLAFQVFDPAFNASAIWVALPPQLDLAELRLGLGSFLPKDFRYGDKGARSTVIAAGINGSWSSEKRKDAAVLVESRVKALHLDDVKVQITSTSLITREVDEATVQDNLPIAVIIILTITVILGLSFRGLSYIFLPIGCLMFAGVWTFGTATLLGIRLIAIDIAVIPLIVGLGVDYFIHISSRYQEELARDGRPGTAMGNALTGIFSSMSLAVLTTIAAFMTNVFTGIQPIREFGVLCALGVGSCALFSVTFYPAARILLDRRVPDARVKSLKDIPAFGRGMSVGARTVRRYPVIVVITVMLVTAGAFLGSLNLRTEFGVEDFVQDDWPEMRTISDIRNGFPAASMYQSGVLLEGNMETPAALSTIFTIHDAATNDRYVVKTNIGSEVEAKVQSAASIFRKAFCVNSSLCSKYNVGSAGPLANCTAADVRALYEHLDTDPVYGAEFSQVMHRGKTGRYDASFVRVYNFVRDTSEGRAMYTELKADAGGHGIATGGTVLTIRTLDSFAESQISSTVVSIVFAVIVLMFIYRDAVLGLLCIIPVAFSCIWVLGTMFLLGISLNALTLTVTSLTIGLGIDYAIYITQRFREEKRTKSPGAAIQATMENLGVPILLCAATTLAGFLVLGLSPMPLVQQFGIVAAATIAYSFVLGVFVFPVFIHAYSRWKEKRARARRDDGR